jgi:hypothetical protein
MTTSRKQPGVAFWVTVMVVVVLVAYPLSFGPACWLADNGIVLPMRATAIGDILSDMEWIGTFVQDLGSAFAMPVLSGGGLLLLVFLLVPKKKR